MLKAYQLANSLKARGKAAAEEVLVEPEAKKRRQSIEPIDRPPSVAALPELPEDLKQKQVIYIFITA